MLRTAAVRQLGSGDLAAVRRALELDPVASCMVAARVAEVGVEAYRVHGELWTSGSPEDSLCFSGANLIPLLGGPDAVRAFGDRARRGSRSCSSLVGPAHLVLPLWEQLAPVWGAARDVRPRQPLLALTGPPLVAPDPLVRPVQPHEIDRYLPAAVAMFTEEVGVDPRGADGGRSYRARVADLIATGRAWARFEDEHVVFKAEIGSLSDRVGQIQGVWVHPARRDRGVGVAGTAAVAAGVQAMGRTPSLYVNDFNVAARRAYDRVGFTEVGTFATVLLH
ncbi:GNAT family N-acetyltransferase [Rhodococcus aerolatus]